jgi:hypothetical protein
MAALLQIAGSSLFERRSNRGAGAYDAIVLACLTLAVPLPLLLLARRTRDRIDRIAESRWFVLR